MRFLDVPKIVIMQYIWFTRLNLLPYIDIKGQFCQLYLIFLPKSSIYQCTIYFIKFIWNAVSKLNVNGVKIYWWFGNMIKHIQILLILKANNFWHNMHLMGRKPIKFLPSFYCILNIDETCCPLSIFSDFQQKLSLIN